MPEKLKLLRKYIDELKSDPQESTLKALRLEVHKMAGSAGSFGFPRTSEICKEFEKKSSKSFQTSVCKNIRRIH
ncbi:MAG: Hpt domain-containing protein [Parachlamydiaceae bacterium]|nr:MAG: Hpt domain-containing protein [Parachlamydiaceae bacterium]